MSEERTRSECRLLDGVWVLVVALTLLVGSPSSPGRADEPLPATESALPATQQEAPLPSPAAVPAAGATVALLPISHAGVDPVVPRRVGEALAQVLTERGFRFIDPTSVARMVAMMRPPEPPLPADVFRITVMLGAARGVHVRVGVEGSEYAADILIASADATGPFRAHVVGGPADFLDRCAEALRAQMPAPDAFDIASAQRYSAEARAIVIRPPASVFVPSMMTRRYQPQPVSDGPRFGLTLVTDSAFGRYGGSRFYNHVLGMRLDFRLSRNVVIGGFAGYINVDRGSQRGSNILAYFQLEDRLRFIATGRVQFPIRLGVGYLPLNGPYVRLAGGVRFR